MSAIASRWISIAAAALVVSACGGSSGGSRSDNGASDPPPVGPSANTADCINRMTAAAIEGSGRNASFVGSVGSVNDGSLTVGCAVVTVTADTAFVIRGDSGTLADVRSGDIVNVIATIDRESGTLTAISIEVEMTDPSGSLQSIVLGEETGLSTVSGASYLSHGPLYRLATSAQVLVDGVATSADGLSPGPGEVLWLSGTLTVPDPNYGAVLDASGLRITHLIDGPVDTVDLEHGRLVVLGQLVFQTSRTAGFGSQSVQVGDRLLVAGHPTASGAVVATGIGMSPNTGEFMASGIIRSLDATARTFVLNGATVNYSAAVLVGLPNGVPLDGQRVIVHATRAADEGTLDATSIVDDSSLPSAAAGTLAAMHGVVTSVTSPTEVTVDGFPVTVPPSALQACESALVANSEVLVDGHVAADGSVFAGNYCPAQPWRGLIPRIQGKIDSIDHAAGSLSVLGFTAQVLPTARVVDADGMPASLNDFQIGEPVRLAGGYGALPGVFLADEIIRETGPAADFVYTRTRYLTFADPVFFVNGMPITTDGATTYARTTRAHFFAGLTNIPCDTYVVIRVRVNADGSLTASLIEPNNVCP